MATITTDLQAHITELEDDAMEREADLRKFRALLESAKDRITELEAQLALAHDGLATAYLAGAESVRVELDALRERIAASPEVTTDGYTIWPNGEYPNHRIGDRQHRVRLLLDTPTVEDGDAA